MQDETRRALAVDERLEELYPGTAVSLCALRFETPFQLLVATVLSAQTTDAAVNLVTPGLFARYPDAETLARAPIEQVEALVRPTGFYRTKARHIVALAAAIVERFGGEVPQGLEELTSLPGVGRKTANVVRSVGFSLPGLPVDTHVKRVSRRLGIARSSTPEGIEQELCAVLAPKRWGTFSLRMILHGRETCTARRPLCAGCRLADLCEAHRAGLC
ncbi:endonuclease III [Acidimicrobium ferrooxidans DSM 10331]|uniref:Endonuclease III n=1 Tax=Acidimicrobium ferrooxidans (strain DSM 10331 / JCM 15462 / NBRC 103882 / ICP) TaxID=525909 RepID=C7M076_ACIFD|nr:endonuclease III [Acidimicrobium ferrooxidans]ACU54384.1 endonuclease III [Acidimicrobium ferrooxidans DSM 10331]